MNFTANKLKFIVIFILIAVLMAGMIFSIVKIVNMDDTKKLSSLNYEIGAIDSYGKFVKDTSTIITKDYVTLDGLKVTLKKGASVSVAIALFNKNGALVETPTFLNVSNDQDIVYTFDKANYSTEDEVKPVKAAIMIKPLHDSEVSWNEIPGYVKQVTVVYNK